MLIDAFLTEVQADMEAVEKKLPRLESNPADGETWNGIIDFLKKCVLRHLLRLFRARTNWRTPRCRNRKTVRLTRSRPF